MSWFGDNFSLPGLAVGGVAGSYLIGQKDKANNAIDNQIAANNSTTFGSNTPGYIDTSKFPQPSQQFGLNNSPWLQFQDQKIQSQVAGAQDQASRQAGAAEAQGLSDVAAHGGMTSGAAERGITNANNQGFQAGADATRAGITASANAGAQNADIWSRMAEQDAQNQVTGQVANSQLAGSMYGANQTANAALQASKKSGIFGLGLGPL
jgi:hypothetical protein